MWNGRAGNFSDRSLMVRAWACAMVIACRLGERGRLQPPAFVTRVFFDFATALQSMSDELIREPDVVLLEVVGQPLWPNVGPIAQFAGAVLHTTDSTCGVAHVGPAMRPSGDVPVHMGLLPTVPIRVHQVHWIRQLRVFVVAPVADDS